MNDFLKAIGLTLLVVLMFLGVIGISFELYSFFGPKYAAVERHIFENTKSYNEGMVRDLENLQNQYVASKTKEEKETLKAIILHRFSIYNESELTPSLRRFYLEVKNENFN